MIVSVGGTVSTVTVTGLERALLRPVPSVAEAVSVLCPSGKGTVVAISTSLTSNSGPTDGVLPVPTTVPLS